MENKKMVTTEELAKFMAVHENTIYNWARMGMPRVKIGNTVRYDLDEVMKWIKERDENSGQKN